MRSACHSRLLLRREFRRHLVVLLGLLALPAAIAGVSPPAEQRLSTVGEIRALPTEAVARGQPVRTRGIVTRATPYELFLQDGTDAIFVWQPTDHPVYRMGDYVEVTGAIHSGHFFPVIKANRIVRLEHRALPAPHLVRYYDLASGHEDCHWVEVEGIVRSCEETPGGGLTLRLAFDGALLRVVVAEPAARVAASMIGARLRLRGVAGGSKTPQRQMIEPVLWVEFLPETFLIVAPGPGEVFAVPIQPANTLLDYGGSSVSGEMVRVQGVATGQAPPNLLFLRDGLHSLEVRLQQPASVKMGDHIEAVGFPELGPVQPILQSAVVRTLSAGPEPEPVRLAAGQLLDFQHEAELVRVEGELREQFRHNSGFVMVVSENGTVFSVDVEAAPAEADRELPPVGSRLSLVGICQIDRLTPPDRFQVVTPASVRLRLRSLADLQVLTRPPWWTTQRLLTAVAILSTFAFVALGWIWTLNRRVRAQTRIILDHARHAAMQEERNRIAREFHDTLEQQLAGTTILLDAIATVLTEQPARAREGLATARAMLRHSLDEAQLAVSDLRNNDLFGRDLKTLIVDAVRERLRPTSIAVDFHFDGTWPNLDTVVKKHILRIVQESVTNAIKHASPTRISILTFGAPDRVELQVVDDGCGFPAQDRQRRGPGEFGLIGLQERAEKIGATLTIRSAPQRGTTVAVSLRRANLAPS